MTRIRDERKETSISDVTPGHFWGDVGVGGLVQGIAGFDLPGTDPADGDFAIWDAATGQWIWINTSALGSGGGMVPYYVAPADTFTVPLYKQALYLMEIDNAGLLVVEGYLLEVTS